MRLIDADRLSKTIKAECNPDGKPTIDYESGKKVLKFIDRAETVPTDIVRCQECFHRDPENKKCKCGEFERRGCPFPVEDDYYCAFGERREDA